VDTRRPGRRGGALGPTGTVETTVHGDGAGWLDARVEGLLGLDDDPAGFAPTDEPLRTLWRRFAGDRVGRTATLWHDLAWWVVQQRVTGQDAAAQWRRLVRALGAPVPGVEGLLAPPDPARVARLGYADLHPLGLERRRAEALVRAASAARRLGPLVDGPFEAAEPALRAVPGIGPWTAGGLASTTWGGADTVQLGDDGIPSTVSWLLAREPRADDARMLALLEPHRPHRYRVVRLALLSGVRPPRRAPRGRRTDVRGW
jgi:3-methyladenine DNA glycosylase/8-oxoguanine DNA glycosylase